MSDQILEEAKQKAIKKLEHASDEAKDLVLETAKKVEFETKVEHSLENHNQIVLMLGQMQGAISGMGNSINELVLRVGNQNGRVGKVEEKYYTLEKGIITHNAEVLKLFNEKNEIIKEMYQWNQTMAKEKKQRDSFFGDLKYKVVNKIILVLLGMVGGITLVVTPFIRESLKYILNSWG